ncbi:MAG: YggS family pyridoxal phosphate-dependent enzyme [Thermomicrobiales bacterium]
MSDDAVIRENVARVRAEIAQACRRVGRSPDEVTLIGVTKSVDRLTADALIGAGVREIAENRVQDAVAKFGRRSASPPLPPDVRLHMIGNLQTNKARDVVALFTTIHSVNRLAVAEALQHAATRAGVEREVLLEVNTAADSSKQGVGSDGVNQLHGYVIRACANLRLVGLMTIAAAAPEPEAARPAFRALRARRDALVQADPSRPLPIHSMGMSNDFPIAIEEGATHVRIGRALFIGLASPPQG